MKLACLLILLKPLVAKLLLMYEVIGSRRDFPGSTDCDRLSIMYFRDISSYSLITAWLILGNLIRYSVG